MRSRAHASSQPPSWSRLADYEPFGALQQPTRGVIGVVGRPQTSRWHVRTIETGVTLADVALPPELVKAFGGPRHGLGELRRRAGAPVRALTCSALKPQGLPAAKLALLAGEHGCLSRTSVRL